MEKLNLDNSLNVIKNIILHGHGLEPITNDLIKKLTKEKGIPIQDLISLQKQGVKYCVSRNSFFFPA